MACNPFYSFLLGFELLNGMIVNWLQREVRSCLSVHLSGAGFQGWATGPRPGEGLLLPALTLTHSTTGHPRLPGDTGTGARGGGQPEVPCRGHPYAQNHLAEKWHGCLNPDVQTAFPFR